MATVGMKGLVTSE